MQALLPQARVARAESTGKGTENLADPDIDTAIRLSDVIDAPLWFGDECDSIDNHAWPGFEPERFRDVEEDEIPFDPKEGEIPF